MQETPMALRLSGSGPDRARHPHRPVPPCIDGFGACVSVLVLIAAATAVFVVRQNLDDHVYSLAAAGPSLAETTGSR
jgi:hypothetical protein